MKDPTACPGSAGEHLLQKQFGTESRALAFYRNQVLDHLNPAMRRFIGEQEMVIVATADVRGECDCSFRAGTPGFVGVLDAHTIVYPEYRGNGVYASLGNITENRHVGLLFVDFFRDTIGLHVNGKASVLSNEDLLRRADLPEGLRQAGAVQNGRRPERWVLVHVEEAYIHCSKHIPLLARRQKEIHWGTDDPQRKGGDYFLAKHCQSLTNDEPAPIAPVPDAGPPGPQADEIRVSHPRQS
jgi:predicted pyridoxine 5'-phosphate oxidase superfamily flavin-nucleotide-binding protein